MSDLTKLTIAQARDAMRKGETSSAEITAACLSAIEGAGALGAYAWRVEDPKGSYAAFYDLSDWLTGFVISGEGATAYLRSLVNLILVDQADGFLLGMAFFALLSLIFWPFRAVGRWGAGRMRRSTNRGPDRRLAEHGPIRRER